MIWWCGAVVARRWNHVQVFINLTIEKRCFNVEVVDVPPVMASKCDNTPERVPLDYRLHSGAPARVLKSSVDALRERDRGRFEDI
ncbi:hypothetical protein KC19_VG194000 [Ceratodon purpureus]|uniref:Uncharacterized protein n=1 Tax=Ceratodon purpureus TaxID=3225 RepID=A0A8T0HS37_CERPU|nr:hypothetical protein KC19_VG194000 [Ceratodon purpureus]